MQKNMKIKRKINEIKIKPKVDIIIKDKIIFL